MSGITVYGSLTRRTDLDDGGYETKALPRIEWDDADYMVAEVVGSPGPYSRIELKTGRLVEVLAGDRIVGALGKRAATLEATGDWTLLKDGELMDLLTPAGLIARETSHSRLLAPFPRLKYVGHVFVDGKKARMQDYAVSAPDRKFSLPTAMIVGTSMSAGKTSVGKLIVRQLKRAGLTVVGAKFAGAGRFRDVLSFGDAGADYIFDFVNMGLPSTVCPTQEYREALGPLLSHISSLSADVLVAEVGASPLEPYNGQTAIEALADRIEMIVLCASDPYAVVGIISAFDRHPQVVTGPCANTLAGKELVKKLTGLPTVDTLSSGAGTAMKSLLEKHLSVLGPVETSTDL